MWSCGLSCSHWIFVILRATAMEDLSLLVHVRRVSVGVRGRQDTVSWGANQSRGVSVLAKGMCKMHRFESDLIHWKARPEALAEARSSQVSCSSYPTVWPGVPRAQSVGPPPQLPRSWMGPPPRSYAGPWRRRHARPTHPPAVPPLPT